MKATFMIQSFSCIETEKFFYSGKISPKVGWQSIQKVVQRKLDMIEAANSLLDLKAPPQNRLEALQGEFKGFYSIRINNQWRIVFKWLDNRAYDVFICDYH